MQTDFFAYSRQKIAKDKTAGRCDVAHNRGAALKCLSNFLGKEVLTFGKLSAEMMTQFKGWLMNNGRKESTARLYLYQIHTLYKEAVKDDMAPQMPLLSGIKLHCHLSRSVSCLPRTNYAECAMPTSPTPSPRLLPATCSSSASIAEE